MKEKVRLIVFAVILALLILFVVIYTWPRTLLNLIDNKEPVSIYATASLTTFGSGQPQTTRWVLSYDEYQPDPVIRSSIMELAGSIKYRRSLRSLLHPSIIEGDHSRLGGNTSLYLHFEDGSRFYLDHLGTAVGITGHGRGGFILATVVNEDALAALSDYIMEIGEKQKFS